MSHQLGRVAEEQRQWPEAEQNMLEALRLFHEFDDHHNLCIVLRSLAGIAPNCPRLAAKAAEILGLTVDHVQQLFDTPSPA